MDFEIKIIQFLQSGRSPFFDVSFQIFSMFGTLLAVCAFLLFLLVYNRKLALCYLLSYGFVFVIVSIVKMLVARERPFAVCEEIELIGKISSDYSFPSGHTACAMSIAIFLGVFLFEKYKGKSSRVWIVLCLTIYVGLVALSRMYLGAHYLTDLLAAMAISAVVCSIGLVVMKIFMKKGIENEITNGDK